MSPNTRHDSMTRGRTGRRRRHHVRTTITDRLKAHLRIRLRCRTTANTHARRRAHAACRFFRRITGNSLRRSGGLRSFRRMHDLKTRSAPILIQGRVCDRHSNRAHEERKARATSKWLSRKTGGIGKHLGLGVNWSLSGVNATAGPVELPSVSDFGVSRLPADRRAHKLQRGADAKGPPLSDQSEKHDSGRDPVGHRHGTLVCGRSCHRLFRMAMLGGFDLTVRF
jgi:hypothetical protein